MTTVFELHAAGISIEKTEDYHTEPKDKQKRFAPKVKIAKAVVYCYTVINKDKVSYHILHPLFPGGEITGEIAYKDVKDEEQALFAGVWDAFFFFNDKGYHHVDIVTTFKRIKSIINGDIETQNNMEEEILQTFNTSIRTASTSLEFIIVDEMPKPPFVRTGDVE